MTRARCLTYFLRAAAIAAILAILASCASPTVVDGWPIGPEADCQGANAARCEALIDAATDAFARRDPGHPLVVRVALHNEGPIVDPVGNPILMTRSVLFLVARFILADGTVRAVGVADSPGGPVTLPNGPWSGYGHRADQPRDHPGSTGRQRATGDIHQR